MTARRGDGQDDGLLELPSMPPAVKEEPRMLERSYTFTTYSREEKKWDARQYT